jgi:hypothetical protein
VLSEIHRNRKVKKYVTIWKQLKYNEQEVTVDKRSKIIQDNSIHNSTVRYPLSEMFGSQRVLYFGIPILYIFIMHTNS